MSCAVRLSTKRMNLVVSSSTLPCLEHSSKHFSAAMLRSSSVALILICGLFQTSHASTPGLIIKNQPGSWYSLKVSNPVVLQLGPSDYRMWAYGRDVGYKGSPVVSFGRTGAFSSKDGIHWTPVEGPAALGSVMSGNTTCGLNCFDSGDVGVTDVLWSPRQGVFYMWYMGIRQTPNSDPPAFGIMPATRGGVAVSFDGIHWATCRGPKSYGSFLEATAGVDGFVFLMTLHPHSVGPNGAAAAAPAPAAGSSGKWQQHQLLSAGQGSADCWGGRKSGSKCHAVIPDCGKLMREAQQSSSSSSMKNPGPCRKVLSDKEAGSDCSNQSSQLHQQQQFRMLYNSVGPVNGSTVKPAPPDQLVLQLFGAVGSNIFDFVKTGPVASLAPARNASPLAPDSKSTGSARVLALPNAAGYLLFYEGVNKTSNRYSINLARSRDGQSWVKDTSCSVWPGGPVLLPGQSDSAWDWYIGTPFPLLQPDGKIFLYYVGFPKAEGQMEGPIPAQIGLAIGHISNPCKFVKYLKS